MDICHNELQRNGPLSARLCCSELESRERKQKKNKHIILLLLLLTEPRKPQFNFFWMRRWKSRLHNGSPSGGWFHPPSGKLYIHAYTQHTHIFSNSCAHVHSRIHICTSQHQRNTFLSVFSRQVTRGNPDCGVTHRWEEEAREWGCRESAVCVCVEEALTTMSSRGLRVREARRRVRRTSGSRRHR